MCAIFGAADYDLFNKLYTDNLDRGDFAFGGVFYDHNGPLTIKPRKIICRAGVYEYTLEDNQYEYYLGHTQAPTSAVQTFSRDTSHPFINGEWIVAHNGVLTNHLKLKLLTTRSTVNTVDSSVIPALLSDLEYSEDSDEQLIVTVCEMLEGTYTLWIHDAISRISYIARCGSTLFADFTNNSFSSTKVDNMKEVPDGSVLKVNNNGDLSVATTFKPNSPFFIL